MPDSPPTPIEVAVLFRKCCDAAGVTYAIFGGLAAIAYSRARATFDVDVLISLEKIRIAPFLRSLADQGFSLDEMKSTADLSKTGMTHIYCSGIRVDLLMPVLPFLQDALRRRVALPMASSELHFVPAEELLVMKMIAFRPRDQEDVQLLLSSPSAPLDIDRIRKLLAELTTPDDGKVMAFEDWYRRFSGPRA